MNVAVLGVAGTCSKAGALLSVAASLGSIVPTKGCSFCRNEEVLHRGERWAFGCGRPEFKE
jgi:hypothetical protein